MSGLLRRLRRARRTAWWIARGRRDYARVVPLDEWSPEERDWAIARGRELAAKYGWDAVPASGRDGRTEA